MTQTLADPQGRADRTDLLTLSAIGLIVYALANALHEGLGHGGACLLVGGKPILLTTMNFQGDQSGLARWTYRFMAAAGTLVNLIAAVVAALILRRPPNSAHTHYFLWLFATANLLVGVGYFMFSGFSNIGDWANVISDLRGYWAWRILLALGGSAGYWMAVVLAMKWMGPLIGDDQPGCYQRAFRLCMTPYIVGGGLYLVAGLLNPSAKALLLISAVAASLGGMCGLVWGPQLLRGKSNNASQTAPVTILRSWPWIIAGVIVSAVFIFVLGPGVRFQAG